MKFLFNGNFFKENDALFGPLNRAFLYGDCVTEYVKVSNGNLVLWEEHYFNLMASVRIFRMSIPISFTQEFLEAEIKKLCTENEVQHGRLRISVFRNADSDEMLTRSTISYLMEVVESYMDDNYRWDNEFSEIEIFKDYTVNPSFFTQVNSWKHHLNSNLKKLKSSRSNCKSLMNYSSVWKAKDYFQFIKTERKSTRPKRL